MILTTIFKSKGGEYSLTLDTDKAERNSDDENYAEWYVPDTSGRVFDVTVWKDNLGRYTKDGIVEVFRSQEDFDNGRMQDKKSIIIRDENKKVL